MMEHSTERANQYILNHQTEINQRYRCSFHAMPPIGWINDPNGLCYFKGQYHLFCQYYPYDAKWGPMHWGHWTSKDLLRWEWIGVAMAPDTPADEKGVFSGHAIVEGDTLIVMYTGVTFTPDGEERQQQCIARSTDGIHFVKDPANPVIPTSLLPPGSDPRNFRDPKLFKTAHGYRATMASRNETGGRLLVYTSDDLKNWKLGGVFASGVGEMLECPDYHEIDGKDVMISCVMNMPKDGYRFPHSNPVTYLLGKTNEEKTAFSIERFEALESGINLYAPQAVDGPDGCVMIGWMPGWGSRFPTQYLGHGWCGCISFPRLLHVFGNKVYQEPIPALRRLRGAAHSVQSVLAGGEMLTGTHTDRAEFCLNIKSDAAFEMQLFADEQNGFLIRFDPVTKLMTIDRNGCGHPTVDEQGLPQAVTAILNDPFDVLELHILLDNFTVEIFANHGERTFSTCVYPQKSDVWQWQLTAQGKCDIQGTVYDLKRADELE